MSNVLLLVPKYERYMEYVILLVEKLPRIEKYNLGNALKQSLYTGIETILYLNKTKITSEMYLELGNKLDACVCIQRIYIRIMYKKSYIDERKYMYAVGLLDELGRMTGGVMRGVHETSR